MTSAVVMGRGIGNILGNALTRPPSFMQIPSKRETTSPASSDSNVKSTTDGTQVTTSEFRMGKQRLYTSILAAAIHPADSPVLELEDSTIKVPYPIRKLHQPVQYHTIAWDC
ncbi:hypothetical protein ACEPPN_016999 [Leptodophora sp. 'Broadleaf-Isolate-01']